MSVPVDPRASIGDEALELRAQLGTALFALSTWVASAGHAPAATLRTLQSLQGPLHEPFLLLAVGEAQAGRSLLLQALFAREFCVAEADKIQVYQYGEASRVAAVSPGVEERFLPLPFLRSFHLVEPPGTNALSAEQEQALVERFAPRADAIFFVFNCDDPWGESPWSLLEKFQPRWLKNVLFVLQQTDLRSAREIQTTIGHLRQNAIARCGVAFPIFAVSAKKAWLAKTSGIDKERLWTDSGFASLEKQISTTLGAGENRREKLRQIAHTARSILRDLTESVRQAEAAIAPDRTRLASLRDTVARLRQSSISRVQGYLRKVEKACDNIEREGRGLLRARLRPWHTLALAFTRRKGWLDGFQKEIETRLQATLAERSEHVAELLENELHLAWNEFQEQLRGDAGKAAHPAAASFVFPRAQFVEEAQRAVAAQMSDGANFGARLEEHLGETGAFGSRQPLLAAYHDAMIRKRARFANVMGDMALQAIEKFYQELAGSYQQLAARCQTHTARYGPLSDGAKTLEKNFENILARLAA
ncbi:MAG: hypothetical protein JO295_00050 [Verrucomicrobia bacterium]|nr:hypothetical protein [Verrucomicrobiota bacterium]